MPRTMTTDWEIIATSGKTVDGRTIEQQWLKDMAETYNPKVYSSKIYLDHERWFGSQGKVVELKVEPATEPELKGEIHLFAKLCPSDDLVYANRRGRYVHSSIEVLKNFRGTGKYYLGGMAVTDEPASVGTTELHFTEKDDRIFISGPELNLSPTAEDTESDSEESKLLHFFKTLLNKDKGESRDTAMDEKQYNALLDGQKKLTDAINGMVEKFSTKPPANNDDADSDKDKNKGSDNKEFVSKKDYDELAEKFKTLETKFTELEKTPVRGTQFMEDLGDVEAEI